MGALKINTTGQRRTRRSSRATTSLAISRLAPRVTLGLSPDRPVTCSDCATHPSGPPRRDTHVPTVSRQPVQLCTVSSFPPSRLTSSSSRGRHHARPGCSHTNTSSVSGEARSKLLTNWRRGVVDHREPATALAHYASHCGVGGGGMHVRCTWSARGRRGRCQREDCAAVVWHSGRDRLPRKPEDRATKRWRTRGLRRFVATPLAQEAS